MKNLIAFFLTMFSDFFYGMYELIGSKVTRQVKLGLPEGWALRGSSKMTTYSQNGSGAYRKSKGIPTQPRTAFQTAVRGLFGFLSKAWRGLTQAQRKAWDAAAKNFPQKNIFGLGFTWSGQNFFMTVGRNLQTIGLAFISNPPAPTSVQQVSVTALAIDNATNKFEVTYPTAINVATSVAVYATPGVSQGKNNVSSLYNLIAVLTDGSLSPKNLNAEYVTKYGALPAAGLKAGVKFRPIDEATGLPGVETTLLAIAT